MSTKMIASSVSFHCMICFEEFDTEKTYPVVLPCGHTYICNSCAHRIDKCMECRASLFAESPVAKSFERMDQDYAVRTGRRNVHRSSPRSPMNALRKKPATPPPKVRLPLPKNLVLLSLIESSVMAQKSVTHNPHLLSRSFSNTGYSQDMDEEENRIVLSADVATGSCGTYAVNTQSGLNIVSSMDLTAVRDDLLLFVNNKEDDSERDIDDDFDDTGSSILRNDSITSTVDELVSNFSESASSSAKTPEGGKPSPASGLKLRYGDRIQVVAILDSHWAKLARGYGYVYFETSKDLIKGE